MLTIVVAVSENNVIGTGNQLPWKLSGDLRRVKNLTMGHHLIMGRKTYESIGRPLPGRTTVILTRRSDFHPEGCTVVHSFEEAIKVSAHDSMPVVFGGAEIFSAALPYVKQIILTRVHTFVDGDTFFPELNPNDWIEINMENFPADEKNQFDCSVFTYLRK